MFWLKPKNKLRGKYSFVIKNSGLEVEFNQILCWFCDQLHEASLFFLPIE